jgi:hypothetical protein
MLGLDSSGQKPAHSPNAIPKDGPLAAEHAQIRLLMEEYRSRLKEISYYKPEIKKLASLQPLIDCDRPQQAAYVAALVTWLAAAEKEVQDFRASSKDQYNAHCVDGWSQVWGPRSMLDAVLQLLLQKKLPLQERTLQDLLAWCLASPHFDTYQFPLGSLTAAIENFWADQTPSDELKAKASNFLARLQGATRDKQCRKYADRLSVLMGQNERIPIEAGEAWSEEALADMANLSPQDRRAWSQLLAHCRGASGADPSAKWLKEAGKLLAQIDRGTFCQFIGKWFPLTEKKRVTSALTMQQWKARCAADEISRHHSLLFERLGDNPRQRWSALDKIREAVSNSSDPWDYLRRLPEQAEMKSLFRANAPAFDLSAEPPAFDPVEDSLITESNMDLLRGLAWTSGLWAEKTTARALTSLALSSFRKVPGKGPRATRVGNACIGALGLMGSQDALGQLALLKVKVKFGGAQAAIEKALNKLAEKLGTPRDDLEEMGVPAYCLTEVGCLKLPLGDFTAELVIKDSRSAEILWKRSDGKPQKSLPASVKQQHAEDVKELLATKKDIEKMLPAQAERLDSLCLQRRIWSLELWQERYLNHPLIGALARRLIWNFTLGQTTRPGIWLKDKLVDRLGHPLELDTATTVSLWHPLDQPVEVVLGWRGFLEEWEIVQPFKQAHREVYLLTPAEEETRVYSNRFAAHLLRQHQFNALCAARGWKNKLRLMVDSEYPPATRLLGAWNLRAEYWIEGAGTEYGTDTLESGAYRYLTTDQVRFYPIDAGQVSAHAGGGGYHAGYRAELIPEPLPLAEVPPLVFSEIMRDVDLFVGVSSVGNDPNWLDGGQNENNRGYWQHYSFGDLNATAQTRKTILERLVPKLKIAAQCTFAEKFLVVQGKRHAYKIHLGSGNILISPQDKYLCIVPGQGQLDKASDKIFLPFEGDRILSVILSKAFLLAADDKISDPTILRQL